MAEVIKISKELGEEMHEDSYTAEEHLKPHVIDGHSYTYYDSEENVKEHRWANTDWNIFKRDDDKLFALAWDDAATESQESGFVYNVPELFEVTEKAVTTSVYEVVK